MSRDMERYEWEKIVVRRLGPCQPEDREHWEHTFDGPFETTHSTTKRIKFFYRCCRCGQRLTDRLVEVLGLDFASVVLPCRTAGYEPFMKRKWKN